MKPTVMTISVEFLEPALGTASANKELLRDYILSKSGDPKKEQEELDAHPDLEQELRKGTTVFPRDDDGPIVWDYQMKGFFKDACSMLRRMEASQSKKLAAHKKEIDGVIFVFPRKIPLRLPAGAKIDWLERPLRAQTLQGERVALARSETVPAGTHFKCEIHVFHERLVKHVKEWLDYGQYRGLLQWRNASYGRFTWKLLKIDHAPKPKKKANAKAK